MLSTNKNNGTITVSSLVLDPNVVATPDRAILNTKELDLGQGHYDAGGWVSGIQDTNQYLQVLSTIPAIDCIKYVFIPLAICFFFFSFPKSSLA